MFSSVWFGGARWGFIVDTASKLRLPVPVLTQYLQRQEVSRRPENPSGSLAPSRQSPPQGGGKMEFSHQGQGRRSSTLPLWLGEAPGPPPRPCLSRLARTSKPRPRHIHASRPGPRRAPRRSKASFLRSPAPRSQASPQAPLSRPRPAPRGQAVPSAPPPTLSKLPYPEV